MRASLLIALAVLLAGCANSRPSARDSGTVYLRSGDALLARSQEPTAKAQKPRPAVKPASTEPAPSEPAPPAGRDSSVAAKVNASAFGRTKSVDEALSARRAQLLKRVEDLSNDDADSVCLTMQLIPREQVFDHGVKPKKLLIRYTNQASSAAELDFLEHSLNDPRR